MSYEKAMEAFEDINSRVNPLEQPLWYDLNLGVENFMIAVREHLDRIEQELRQIRSK